MNDSGAVGAGGSGTNTNTNATDPLAPQRYRVRRRRRELADSVTLTLTPADGGELPAFRPGQFNMLYRFGVGEIAISISGDPAGRGELVHTIRAVGAVSRALTELKPGAVLGVRGPYGSGWPVEAAHGRDLVIVAGGLGLAPLRPAIYQMLAERAAFGNVCIYYGARSPDEILYLRQLRGWRGRFDLDVEVTVDRAGRDWAGRVGVVTRLIERGFDPEHTTALICGPEVMMRFAVEALNQRGVADPRIHVSMERNMRCAVGLCGHCQFGPGLVCRDGPVYRFDRLRPLFRLREL